MKAASSIIIFLILATVSSAQITQKTVSDQFNHPAGDEIDTSINYANYYFLEALYRAHRANVNTPHKVLVLAERGGGHEGFTATALDWLQNHSEELNIELTIVSDARTLEKGDIDKHNLVLQLNYPPYEWSEDAIKEFEHYIDECKGAYIGFHHATLLGDFDGYPMWQWFSDFMGGVVFKTYIPQLADGTVQVENSDHPVMKGLPQTFVIPNDEWYTYNTNPRINVQVLAHVDEASYVDKDSAPEWGPKAYHPMPTMGDHPVIWTNPQKKARNVYFQFGHDKTLFETPAFVQLLINAINWTLAKD